MTSAMQQVCKEMDDLSLRMLELMEEQLQNSIRTETMMKYGFIDIAKARYIMGNRNLSSLQLPSENSPEFTAQSTVSLSPVEDEQLRFVLNTVAKTQPKLTSTNEDGNLRKRGDENKGIEIIREETVKVVDPIRWFGVLVPQNLRKAQTCFTNTLELTTQAANIHLEMESTRNKYNKLGESKTCRLSNMSTDFPSEESNEQTKTVGPTKRNKKNPSNNLQFDK